MATERSVEVRVGLFVLVCVAVVGGLVWQFGKLQPAAGQHYPLFVMFDNVGGLITDANVMYAGVSIGKVRQIQLVEDSGRLRARVELGIEKDKVVREDAKFVINQSGLLGDRYVDVIPGSTVARELKPGATVRGSPSVDLTEAIRGVVDVLREAAGTIDRVNHLISRVDGAVQRVVGAMARVDEILLSTQNMVTVSHALANVEAATSNAIAFTAILRLVTEESRAGVTNTLGRLSLAADHVNETIKTVDALVRGAQDDVQTVTKNLVAGTGKLNAILERLERGEGSAGKLLADPSLHDELLRLVRNLREHGLLYKEGTARPVNSPEPPRRGRTPIPARPAGKDDEHETPQP